MQRLLALPAALPLLLALAPSPAAAACAASAPTLSGARVAYAAACPTLPRVDCDPSGGGWTCSSGVIGARAPAFAPVVGPPAPVPAPTPAPTPKPAPAVPAQSGGACTAEGGTLPGAKAAYALACAAPRVDCDPVAGGAWRCSSAPIGAGAGSAPAVPPVAAPAPSTPSPGPAPAPSAALRVEVEMGAGNGWANTGTSLRWLGGNRFAAPQADGSISYVVNVPVAGAYRFNMRGRASVGATSAEPPNDVWVRFGSIPWTKAFFSKTAYRDGQFHVGANGERAGAGPNRPELITSQLPKGPATITISGRSNGHELDWIELVPAGGATPAPAPAPSPSTAGDLLSLHWDSAPDIDDLQAMIAVREVLDDNRVANVLSVAGTVRQSLSQVRPGTDEINDALYGSDAVNALEGGTLGVVAARWREVLQRGGTVYVAEGGPSDFTARVLRELVRQGVGGLKRVRVVQHSAGANQTNTSAANLADVRRLATYINIPDGNVLNGTPGYLEKSASAAASFRARALASTYGPQWARAFLTARQVGRDVVDFSDAVEAMYILGLPTSTAPNPTAFANRYF